MENQPRYYDAVWAALNNQLYVTSLSSPLVADEVAYILRVSIA
jgi:hypothetical protein